jgi:nitronate monooxygenase
MKAVDDYRLQLGSDEYVPIVVGGMGVNISTADLALEACRLGGIGHVSDAMSPFVADKKFGTHYTKTKTGRYKDTRDGLDKTTVKFDLEELARAQRTFVDDVMARKRGDGAIFINVMEKLTMGAAADTLRARLNAALDAGIDGVTLSAGLHNNSLKLIKDNARFRDVKIGIIVSSVRALKIFLRSAKRCDRFPDYVIVEGPLAGGHLGFGEDWADYQLKDIVAEVIQFLRDEALEIPVIPAGGVFTGTDAVEYLEAGAAAVQVATRFTVTRECGLPERTKQAYFRATEDDVFVSTVSATGYLLRLLTISPCLGSNVKPQCEPFGYTLSSQGTCSYLDAYAETPFGPNGKKLPVESKICLCYHFSKNNCYTCGHYVYRLKDTSRMLPDGQYQLLSAEHVFRDYQFSKEHEITRPAPEMADTVGLTGGLRAQRGVK